ncbi:MAG TPA: LamG domain-containing protein [Terriglobales bacterium]|nr:LamG domain-containing protein [Terriglobales bacterium]
MRQAVLAAAIFLICMPPFLGAQSTGPEAEWLFDEVSGQVTRDSVNGVEDSIQGRFKWVQGVSGNGLRFDGESTAIVRGYKHTPETKSGVTVDAWVAVNAYPWNWLPIVEQRREEQAGYSFGIDCFGHLGMKVAVDGQWWSLLSEVQLPLKRWAHIAGSYDPATGIAIYINGRPAGQLALRGALRPAERQDLVIGRAREPILPAQWIHPKIPVRYSFDGILDDLRIYGRSLSPQEIAQAYSDVHAPAGEVLPWPVLPSGPPGVGRFGAFYTTLHYDDMWDEPRRVAPNSDVVVRFDLAPIRMVFWQGTNYGGDWVTENNKWYTDEFLETGGEVDCPGGEDCEPMSDKQNRYSHVRILETSDARAVVHWRYGLCEVVNYSCANPDPNTGWTDWADEYFTIYPDGVAVRKQVLWTSNFKNWHEFQETIIINGPGTRPEDNIQPAALTIGNMAGETVTYSWENGPPPTNMPTPEHPNLQMVNLKSEWKPFQIVPPTNSSITAYTGEVTYSMFEWWNHWPVAQVRSSGISAVAPDRPSHSSLSHIYWDPYTQSDTSMTKLLLHGLTRKSAKELIPLAKSWLSPPSLEISGTGFQNQGYDPSQRAFVIVRQTAARPSPLRLSLPASPESPLSNPAFVIRNWGDQEPTLLIDGEPITRGSVFRYGFVPTLDASDLVIWLKMESASPTRMELSARSR